MMKRRKSIKFIHEGMYVAQVEVELIDTNEGWSPYLSLADVYRLDDIRQALRVGDIVRASGMGEIFTLTPVVA